jgi:phage tail tape-measure protein
MNNDDIVRMTGEAGGFDATPAFLKRFAELVAAAEREAIADEYWSSLLSDMEHGVKCLNIQAAKDFNRTMPELSKFGRWLNDRSEA